MIQSCCRLQVLVGEVQSYGERKMSVETAATRLLELSRKEDCDVVQNLIMTVQDRYKKLLQHTTDRGKTLEDVKRHAKQVSTSHMSYNTDRKKHLANTKLLCFSPPQFSESWHLLVDWMTEVEQTLDTHKEIAVSQEEIKQQLTEQKVLHISALSNDGPLRKSCCKKPQ